VAVIRAAVQSVDCGVPVFGVETMQQRMDQALPVRSSTERR
jgi:hypothetical protein